MDPVFILKNFKRSKDCILTIKSIRHFCDNEIYILNLFSENLDEYLSHPNLSYAEEIEKLVVQQYFGQTKYNLGPGEFSPANGLYYSEGINYCFEIFKTQNRKVILLDENVAEVVLTFEPGLVTEITSLVPLAASV